MKLFRYFIVLLLILSTQLFSQNYSSSILEGKVLDAELYEPIKNVTVFIDQTNYITRTGSDGTFIFQGISPGSYVVLFSRIGYVSKKVKIKISSESELIQVLLESSPVELGNVVVSSAKYVQEIKTVPFPMEAVASKRLDSKSFYTVADALQLEPGISLQRDGIWATSISLRGLTKHNLVTLVDGNRIETSSNLAAALSLVDLNDIERIEVMKGSVSSLYGSGATGGVVNILTKDGTYRDNFTFDGRINSSYNSVNKGSSGNIQLNAGAANWFAKFNSTLRYADDTETPEGKLDNSQFRDNYFSVDVGIRPFENHEIKFTAQRFNATDVGIPGGEPFPGQSTATYKDADREMYSLTYSVNSPIPSLSNVAVKYFYQKIYRNVEIIPNPNAIVNPYATHKIHGAQLQTNWVINQNNFLIAGIDFWQREYDGKRERTIIPQKRKFIEEPLPNSRYLSIGLFAQDEMKLSESFKLTLGGRIDQINVSNEKSYIPIAVVNSESNEPVLNFERNLIWNKENADDFSWSTNLAALYNIIETVDLTLNAARSFRSPTLEERYQFIELGGATYYGDPNLKPEQGWFFDAGIRYWGKRISARSNVFINLFNDLVIDEHVNDTVYVKNNVGQARLYGFEISAEYNIAGNFVMFGNVSYVRGKDTDSNQDLPQIPPLNGLIGLRSKFADIINITASASFAADQKNAGEGERTTGGYATYDLFVSSEPVSFGVGSVTLHAGVENMFDRSYRNHLSTYRGITQLEPGRNFFVKVGLEW